MKGHTTTLHGFMARLCLLAICSPCGGRSCAALPHLTPQAGWLGSRGGHARLSLALCLQHLRLQSLHRSALLVQPGLLLLQAVWLLVVPPCIRGTCWGWGLLGSGLGSHLCQQALLGLHQLLHLGLHFLQQCLQQSMTDVMLLLVSASVTGYSLQPLHRKGPYSAVQNG